MMSVSRSTGCIVWALWLQPCFVSGVQVICEWFKDSGWLAGVLLAQVSLGISNVVFSLPLAVAVARQWCPVLVLVALPHCAYPSALNESGATWFEFLKWWLPRLRAVIHHFFFALNQEVLLLDVHRHQSATGNVYRRICTNNDTNDQCWSKAVNDLATKEEQC